MLKKIPLIVVILIFFTFIISACSPIIRPEQSGVIDTILLDNHGTIGQTFVAHYDGLQGIDIYFEPIEPGNGEIFLSLNDGPMEPVEITSGSISLDTISAPGFYIIQFPPQKDSTQEYYYLYMEIQGSGAVNVGKSPGDSYLNGALYQDHKPLDSQLSFNLVYKPANLAFGLLKEGLTWIGYLLAAGFLFVIPGWAIFGHLYPYWKEQEWLSKIALSAGFSLAFFPLLFLWTDVVGIHIGKYYAWIPPLLGISAILWRNRDILSKPRINISEFNIKLPEMTLILILGMIFFVRFWVIRCLDTPIGSDSLHHTIATQLIIENGGLMHSWLPYLELSTFTYHFGFHTLSALFHWVTRMPTEQAVLITGQILNGLAIVSLYPLAKRISNNKWSGVIMILLAGLLFPMPMYYINWGRYTQLASQIILPILIILIWDILKSQRNNVALIVFSAIFLAGLGVTHYRIFLLSLFFFPAYLIIYCVRVNLETLAKKISSLAIGAFLLLLPWMINIIPSKLSKFFTSSLSIPADQISETVKQLRNLNYITYLPGWAWILLPVVIGMGLWKRKKPLAVIFVWWFLALIFANPSLVNLPGDGLISHGAVITGFYIPSSLLIGSFIGSVIENLEKQYKWTVSVIFLILIILAFKGTFDRKNDILQDVIQVTRTDMLAIKWIDENLPQDITFLTNSTPIFSAKWWYAGMDGGWWIQFLAKRETTTKPMIYVAEKKVEKGKLRRLNNLTQQAIDFGVTDPEVLSQLIEHNITYIYKGQTSNNILGTPISTVVDDPRFKLIFSQDKVRIFEISN